MGLRTPGPPRQGPEAPVIISPSSNQREQLSKFQQSVLGTEIYKSK